MLILFGTNTKELARVPLSLQCPQCGERGGLELYVLTKNFTMFFVSALPVEKMGIVGCNACQATFVKQEMSARMLEETNVLMNRHQLPWYNYMPGIIVVIATFSALLLIFTS
jgi:hypothetical protein